jgi:hypothetical protein
MIYACLRFLREWASPLTPLNFTLLGGASGFTLAAALAALVGRPRVALPRRLALVLTLLAALGRWRRCAQRAAEAEVDAADGHRHQAPAHRAAARWASWAGLVQHARVLPRQARRAAHGQACVPAVLAVRAADGAAGRWRDAGEAGAWLVAAFACSIGGCWPSAGSSSRRPITRRTSTTRRCRDAVLASRFLAVVLAWAHAAVPRDGR